MSVGIVNNDFADVVLNRTSMRSLDPHFKISRYEILQMLRIAMTAPSAVNTQPWHFLVVDTDEGKQKLDQIMNPPVDRGRIVACSFAVVVFADRGWSEDFDELLEENSKVSPMFTPEVAAFLRQRVPGWLDELGEDGLDRSVSFQAGLATMNLLLAARAHGYEAGPMDDWQPWELDKAFDIDLKRYIPMIVVAVGKPTAAPSASLRRDPMAVVTFA